MSGGSDFISNNFVLSIVDDIGIRNPIRPTEGNRFFRGPGQGVPNGGPELVVDAIPTRPGTNSGITQIIVNVGP